MGDTSISWTDKTWNCIRGCSRVSPGCQNCYAERTALRMSGVGQPYHGLVISKRRVVDDEQHVEARWTGKVVFDVGHLFDPLRWRTPRKVFVNSMSDIFHDDLTNEQIAAMFGVMAAAPRHTFQVLTKRAHRMRAWFGWLEGEARACNGGVGMTPAARCFVAANDPYFTLNGQPNLIRRGDVANAALSASWPLRNVWMGVSVESQEYADKRIPVLLGTPAAVRFLSCEPLLGPLTLEDLDPHWVEHPLACRPQRGAWCALTGQPRVDQVIVGCESGPRARACELDHVRSIRDQCLRAGVALFVKQLVRDDRESETGEPYVHAEHCYHEADPRIPKVKPRGVIERPFLDGRQHLEFP